MDTKNPVVLALIAIVVAVVMFATELVLDDQTNWLMIVLAPVITVGAIVFKDRAAEE